MECPRVWLAAKFLLQIAIFYWRIICLIEESQPNWQNFFAGLGDRRRWLRIGVVDRSR